MPDTLRTIIESQKVSEFGHLIIRFRKERLNDQGEIVEFGYHMVGIEVGENVDFILDQVNRNLVDDWKVAAVDVNERKKIKDKSIAEWTPVVRARWNVEKEKNKVKKV